MRATWSTLGAVEPRALAETRLALHYAAQPMAAVATALLPARQDDSHTNLLWSHERNGFVGRALPDGKRCFLDVVGLRTGVLASTGEPLGVVELAETTLDQAVAAMAALSGSMPRLPEYDLPAAPYAQGLPFPAPSSSALEELARWFGNGSVALARIAAEQLGGAEVRVWPHHLDIAAFLALDPDADAERARSLNVGLSPGDDSYAEPYFYVTPWPPPPGQALPELPRGAHWHTQGFTAAVLLGSELVTGEGVDRQLERALGALRASVDSCRTLLGAA